MKNSDTLKNYIVDMSRLADLTCPDKEPNLVIDQSIHKEKLLALSGFREYFDQYMLMDWFMGDEKACLDFLRQLDQKVEKDWDSQKAHLISESTLGEYFPSRNEIVIYEKPCMIVSGALNCGFKELIMVVLAHETAHFLTHLGLDRYQEIWHNYELALEKDKELFAQIYPYLLFTTPEYNELMSIFLSLCERQSAIYNNWNTLQDYDKHEINEELIRTRRKQINDTMPLDGEKDDIVGEALEDINDNIDRAQESQSTRKPVGNAETGDTASGGGPDQAPVVLSDKYNVIPGNVRSACRQVLIVEIRSDDDVEKRILQALVHIYSHCPGITRYVFFKAEKWDIKVWQRHAKSFKGVNVFIYIGDICCEELVDINSSQTLPWHQKSRNRKVLTTINNRLSVKFAPELQSGIIENDFTLLRNSESNIATSRCVIKKDDLSLSVQCYIDGLDYGFTIIKNSGQRFMFADLVNLVGQSFYFKAQNNSQTILAANGYVADWQDIAAIVSGEYIDLISVILQWEA